MSEVILKFAFFKHLKKKIVNVMMRLLDFIKKNN